MCSRSVEASGKCHALHMHVGLCDSGGLRVAFVIHAGTLHQLARACWRMDVDLHMDRTHPERIAGCCDITQSSLTASSSQPGSLTTADKVPCCPRPEERIGALPQPDAAVAAMHDYVKVFYRQCGSAGARSTPVSSRASQLHMLRKSSNAAARTSYMIVRRSARHKLDQA